jgi:hypothetical protein
MAVFLKAQAMEAVGRGRMTQAEAERMFSMDPKDIKEEAQFIGREVRRVPANWEHPRDGSGNLIPLDANMPYTPSEIQEGLEEGWLKNTPPDYGMAIMPQWPEAEKTHLQMYETTSEGTPVSPVFDTAENLARWLHENQIPIYASRVGSYEQWLDICQGK